MTHLRKMMLEELERRNYAQSTIRTVVVRSLCPNHRETFRMSFVACSTIIAQVCRSTCGETCLPHSVKHFRSAVLV
jgi:hypothetical protein